MTLQKKYLEYQAIESQMQQMQKQLEAIEGQMMEVALVGQGLEDLEKVKEGTEVLMPFSNGIFTKASLKKGDTLFINVGSNVVVEKTLEETKKLMEKQSQEILRVRNSIVEKLQELSVQALRLEEELRKLVK